ncbi:CAP domain-containing protein [Sphingomonas arenae]|uniref:CAP domain-containing protein n=1 Tax=Sphingomonas arenae TaxID=2812555 RepID=UPI0019682DD7|nr:CAP domain-containing protein [Sphingomonas arenae]
MRSALLVLSCLALTFAPTKADAWPLPSTDAAAALLAVHNRERAAVGAPPLQWDPALAQAAASYGPQLASLGRLVHSPREGRPGQRENLAMDYSAHTSVDRLIGTWVVEKRDLLPGAFPNVSRTGNWKDVAHYTQMVWKTTTHVGCAIHSDGRQWSYLICRYSPPGNVDGRRCPEDC